MFLVRKKTAKSKNVLKAAGSEANKITLKIRLLLELFCSLRPLPLRSECFFCRFCRIYRIVQRSRKVIIIIMITILCGVVFLSVKKTKMKNSFLMTIASWLVHISCNFFCATLNFNHENKKLVLYNSKINTKLTEKN